MKMKIPEGPFALSCLLVAIFFAQNAFGTFTDATLNSSLYDMPLGITTGECEVCQHDTTNELPAYDIDPFSSNINPIFYTAGGAPVQSADHRFEMEKRTNKKSCLQKQGKY
jgi:hypothetical protein